MSNTTAERFAPTLERYATAHDHKVAPVLATQIRAALESPASGTLKAWMQAHDNRPVHTLQLNRNDSPWSPLGRVVDASSPSRVVLGESARYYAGVRVLHTTPTAIIVSDESMGALIAYVAAGSEW